MSFAIIQSQAINASGITLASQPADTSVLALFVKHNNAASPSGCATTWTKIANATDEWRGVGPFNGTSVLLTAGRTPPKVDAVLLEVGP